MQEKNKIWLLMVLLLMIISTGCRQTAFTPEEYVAFVNDPKNGYIRSEQVGNYEVLVQYRSPEYLTSKDLNADLPYNQERFMQAVSEKRDMYCFLFQIMSHDKKNDPLEFDLRDHEQYLERVTHLISGIDKDMLLLSGSDTFPCIMHHFERSYHLTYYHNIMLTFLRNGKSLEDDLRLVYDDKILNIGKLNFVFDKSILTDKPTITL